MEAVEHKLNLMELEEMSDNEQVLVNTNKLFWKLSEISRREGEKETIQIITKALEKDLDVGSMYIPMNVHDVKKCFERNSEVLPENTLRRF